MADPTSFVIKGGRIIDQTGERTGDVVVAEGQIAAVGPDLRADRELDASGCIVSRGLVDLHAHLREPGFEESETVESASRCAVLGGYTAIVAMPDTNPAVDNPGTVREVQSLATTALCDIEVAGTITVDRAGTHLAPIGEMAALGIRIFTDAGRGVQDDRLMRRALEYSSSLDVVLTQHCDVESLSRGGHMHEGRWSSRLGIPGMPAEAEELMVLRDIALSRLTGGRVHFALVSTAGSLAMVQAARSQGVPVSCSVDPHHFTLSDDACQTFDPNTKLNPPLRSSDDVAAIRASLAAGAIEAIASGHAPQAPHTKEVPFDEAPFGATGLEHALALALTELDLPLTEVLALMSWRPAAIAGVADAHASPITEGSAANLAIFDPKAEWTIDLDRSASLSRNSPYAGRRVSGRVRHTITNGEIVVEDGVALR